MIDFHSHVLPGIDDGSKSVTESLDMLEASAGQGVSIMAATPHFYPEKDTPDDFFRRRERAWEQLCQAWQPHFPRLVRGAEVHYFHGIRMTGDLSRMRIEGTPLLLLEMPFSRWSDRMVEQVIELNRSCDVTVVLAHIERYLRFQKPDVWERLLEHDVLMQANAEFFLRWPGKRRALQLLQGGKIHLLGSDAHNMSARPPRLGEALSVIRDKLGRKQIRLLEQAGLRYMAEEGAHLS